MKGTVAMNRSMGEVIRLRLAPREVMSCIDCVEAAGVKLPAGTSMAQVVKRGVMIALNTLREEKAIPTREGYEYLEMVQPYLSGDRVSKIEVGHHFVMQDSRDQAQDAQTASIRQARAEATPQEARLLRQRAELLIKQDVDPLNFDAGDQSRLAQVTKQLEKIRGNHAS